jgi:hypothetical protein
VAVVPHQPALRFSRQASGQADRSPTWPKLYQTAMQRLMEAAGQSLAAKAKAYISTSTPSTAFRGQSFQLTTP